MEEMQLGTNTKRKSIGSEEIEHCYNLAKKVYHNQLEKEKAIKFLTNDINMNESSAKDYIYVFHQMIQGLEYNRTINQDATRYYLEKIKVDYGTLKQCIALEALKKHIDYYNKQGNGRLSSLTKLLEEYECK